MKKILTILSLLIISLTAYSQSPPNYLRPGILDSAFHHNSWGWSTTATMVVYLPWDYYITTKNYPMIMSFSGNGEKGAGGTALWGLEGNGIPQLISQGHPPYSVDKTTGDTTWFIVTALQTTGNIYNSNIPGWYQDMTLSSAYGLRVDTNRIYLTGYSQGGEDCLRPINEGGDGFTPAAIVSMSPAHAVTTTDSYNLSLFSTVPVWFFQGDNDGTVGQSGTISYDTLLAANPSEPLQLTQYSGGHCCWNTYYDPSWSDATDSRTSPSSFGGTIYQWMMNYSLDTTSTLPSTDTSDYQIVLSPYNKFWKGDTVFYQITDLNGNPAVDSLFDEQSKTPFNGLIPTTNFSTWQGSQPKYHSEVVIDLGGMYKIDTFFTYAPGSYTPFIFQYGQPFNWSTDTISVSPAGGWGKTVDSIYTRYLKVQYGNGGNPKIYELELWGHLVSDSLSRTYPNIPQGNYGDGNTMGDFMGINIAGVIPPYLFTQVAGVIRNYANQYYLDTSLYQHNIDSVNFLFSKFSGNSTTLGYYYPGGMFFPNSSISYFVDGSHADSGMLYMYHRNKAPYYLPSLQDNNQMEMNNSWGKTIDRINHPNADTLSPQVYDRFSRMAWQLGAAFGKNTYPSDSLQYTIPSLGSGLNTMQYIEPGNEIDGTWKGLGYYSPGAFIAAMSAFYDGDDKLMGSRMGIKNADSTIQVVMPGLAAPGKYYFTKALKYFTYYNLPSRKIPFDIYNFHSYTYSSTQDGSAAPIRSTQEPEDFSRMGFTNMRTYWESLVDSAHEICPRCGVWNTEWGYDRNGGLPNGVPYIQGQDSAQVQAYWTARAWFMQSFVKGLGASVYYMLGNANYKDMDSSAFNNYATCGLLSQYIGLNPAGTCCATDFYAFPVYYYTSDIFQSLNNYKPDSIIYENGLGDSLYVYRYRNAINNDSVCYVVWSGTQSNKVLNNYVLRTGHPSTGIEQNTLADKYLMGVDTTKEADANGNLAITITESPKLYFTTMASIGGTLSDSSSTQKNMGPTLNISSQSTSMDSTVLTATATPGNSPIISYKWTQLSGPAIRFSLPSQNQDSAQVANIANDTTYTFRVIATDANGLTDSKTVTLVAGNGGGSPVIPPGTKPKALLYIINGKLVIVNE